MKCYNCPKDNISHGGPFLDCRFCEDHCNHSPAMPRYERFKSEPQCKCIVDNCCEDHWQECICEEQKNDEVVMGLCLKCPNYTTCHSRANSLAYCRYCSDHCDHPNMSKFKSWGAIQAECDASGGTMVNDFGPNCRCCDDNGLIERKDMETFIPCGTKLLVKKFDTSEKKSAHGIIISTTNENETVARGEIVATGDYDENYDFHEGDVLVFPKYAGMAISEDLLILKLEDILAKVKQERVNEDV